MLEFSSKLQNIEPKLQTFPKAKLDNFFVLQTLGAGAYAKVKLIEDFQGNRYAAKIFDQKSKLSFESFRRMVDKEVRLTQQLNHPNIIKIIEAKEKGQYTTFKGRQKSVCYIVMEIAEGGTLIDYLMQTGLFQENVSRNYFKQMLNALTIVHQNNIMHRDLKPENILFDVLNNIKLCDFGLATYCVDQSGEMQTEFCGTPEYWAPELHERKPYDGFALDIYALGLVLFILVTGSPAFRWTSLKKDEWFRMFVEKNEVFWTKRNIYYQEDCGQDLSPTFIDLMNKMLARKPKYRLSLEEIWSHPWLQEEEASLEELQTDFKQKLTILREQQLEELEKKKMQMSQSGIQPRGQKTWGKDMNSSAEVQISLVYESEANFGQNPFIIPMFNQGGPLKFTQFTTFYAPDEIFNELDSFLGKNANDYETTSNFKIKAFFEEDENEVGIQFKIYAYKEDKFIVDMLKIKGLQYYFFKCVKNILVSSEIQAIMDRSPFLDVE